MRLSETAPIILNIIKNNRRVNAKEISKISGLAIRRVYDVTIVLEALELVDVDYSREKTKPTKIFIWRGLKIANKKVKANSRKIKVSCVNGTIIRIQNRPIDIIIEGSHNLTVENYVDHLSK